ncbi:unnamed protein product, partial [Ascophyllum nodosum]
AAELLARLREKHHFDKERARRSYTESSFEVAMVQYSEAIASLEDVACHVSVKYGTIRYGLRYDCHAFFLSCLANDCAKSSARRLRSFLPACGRSTISTRSGHDAPIRSRG